MAALTSAPLWLFACSWIIVHCKDTQEETAKPGENVTLQCRGPRGASISLIKWSRTDPKSDQYVFLLRDGRSYENYLIPSFRGRVELRDPEMKDGDASVVLKNVTTNDTGTYECRVSAGSNRRRKRATETFSTIKLTVTDPDPGLTEGHKEEGNKDGGNKDSVGVRAGLPVAVLLLVVGVVGVVVGLVIFRGLTAAQKEGGNKDGGNKEGGNKDGGNKDGRDRGVGAGVPVAVLLVVGVVVGLIFRGRRGRTEKNSHQPAETESVFQQE